ncbi:MAG: hypothetical protein AAGK00_00600 [Pseudomonadota bacterium]
MISHTESETVYGVTETKLFRLTYAYTAIQNPKIRAEFLCTVEARANEQ